VPRYAFWINDTDPVVRELDAPPGVGDEVDLGDRGRHLVTIERPNHDDAVDAAYTAEQALRAPRDGEDAH